MFGDTLQMLLHKQISKYISSSECSVLPVLYFILQDASFPVFTQGRYHEDFLLASYKYNFSFIILMHIDISYRHGCKYFKIEIYNLAMWRNAGTWRNIQSVAVIHIFICKYTEQDSHSRHSTSMTCSVSMT